MNARDTQIQLAAEIQSTIEKYEEESGMFVADIRIHRSGPILIGIGLMTTVNKQWGVEPESPHPAVVEFNNHPES